MNSPSNLRLWNHSFASPNLEHQSMNSAISFPYTVFSWVNTLSISVAAKAHTLQSSGSVVVSKSHMYLNMTRVPLLSSSIPRIPQDKSPAGHSLLVIVHVVNRQLVSIVI